MLFIAAVQLAALGILGDVLAGSRVIQQRILERVRRVELQLGVEPSHYEPGSGPRRPARTTGAEAGPATGKPEEPRGAEAVSQQVAEAVPTGNTYDKYGSTNPVVRRLMEGFDGALDELWERPPRSPRSTSAVARAC